jgi:hypothetical protein
MDGEMRVRVMIAVLFSTALAGVLVAGPAAAHDGDDDHEVSTSVTPPIEGGVGIGDEIYLTGATITSPTGEPVRTLDAYHAAAFVQSFLASAFFGGPEIVRDPPPELPVHRVDVTGSWAGEVGTVTVYYTADGATPFIAFPGIIAWTDPTDAPPPSSWFMPPARVIDAFNGEAELLDTTGTQMATVSSTTAPAGASGDEAAGSAEATGAGDEGSDSSSLPVLPLGAALVVLVAGGAVWMRRRRA